MPKQICTCVLWSEDIELYEHPGYCLVGIGGVLSYLLCDKKDRPLCYKHNSMTSFEKGSIGKPPLFSKSDNKTAKVNYLPHLLQFVEFILLERLRYPHCNKEQSRLANAIHFPPVKLCG